MARSPLWLAAAALAALPGADIITTRAASVPGDFDAAEIMVADKHTYLVIVPRDDLAGAAQQADIAVLRELRLLTEHEKLPFGIPLVKGSGKLSSGERVLVTTVLRGAPIEPASLVAGPGLAADLGRSIAAIHELPTSFADRLGLDVYTADEYRQRHLAQLDAAAETGLVPPVLLERWESALDDVSLWRFNPVFVHGDLAPEFVLASADGQVASISGWSNARVADPADDLAWILASAAPEAADSVLEAYQMRRTETRDPRLAERAMLLSELAIARWLHYGVREQDQAVIADAQVMLADLAAAVASETELNP